MFVIKVKSDGLAQLSYVLGDGKEAAVVDPRRDVGAYLDIAAREGARIIHVFETHRNEDLVSGAAALSHATGAKVHHGPNPAGRVAYADTVHEGDEFTFGDLRLRVLETPGHTDDSLSFAIFDTASGEDAVGVFTGDALFIGDVGRTDFYPDRAEEVAGLLYDSLEKILSLGDQAILYPAHGAGSVCGSGMANREFSTLGYERRNNPMLRIRDRDEFVHRKVAEHHDLPPYFRLMERINLEGAPGAADRPRPEVLDTEAAAALRDGGAAIVDVRPVEAFCGSHVPRALSLPAGMIPAYAGWLLEPDEAIVLVADDAEQAGKAARHLARIGYDGVKGYLPGMMDWITAGRDFRSLITVDAHTVAQRRRDGPDRWSLLDVRKHDEVEAVRLEGAAHVFLGELPARLQELRADGAYTVMCGSGARATVGASVLERAGLDDVDVFLGSIAAWRARYG